MTTIVGTVYLIHFARPYQHARHYTGWASDLPRRLAEHATGHGARLLSVIAEAGIGWTLARTWPNSTRSYERCLKNQGGAARRCPICRGNTATTDPGSATPGAPQMAAAPLLGIDPATGQGRTRAVCESCHQARPLIDFDLADPTSRTCLICCQRPARYGPIPTLALTLRPAWDAAPEATA